MNIDVVTILGLLVAIIVPTIGAIVYVTKGTTKIQINDHTLNLKFEELSANVESNNQRINMIETKYHELDLKLGIMNSELKSIDKHLEFSNKLLEKNSTLFEKIILLLEKKGG